MLEINYEETSFPRGVTEQKSYAITNTLAWTFTITAALFVFIAIFIFPIELWLFDIVTLILLGGLAAIMFVVRRKYNNLFDYAFVTGEVRIVKVVGGCTRKKVAFFDSTGVIQVGRKGSDSYKKIISDPRIKPIIAHANKTASDGKQLFYIFTTINNNKTLFIIETTDKFISLIINYSQKGGVLERDYK